MSKAGFFASCYPTDVFHRISSSEVEAVVTYGEIIEENPNDTPFTSYLLFDFVENKPIHVVFYYVELTNTGYIVTAYIPDRNLWSDDFRTRR
ncbi:MAG: DUF4258 domain-containing protein [Nostoc sp.]